MENSPSKVAEADQPFIHFISIAAVVSAGVGCLRRAVGDEACTGECLERGCDRTVRIEVVRPGKTAAQRQDAVRLRP